METIDDKGYQVVNISPSMSSTGVSYMKKFEVSQPNCTYEIDQFTSPDLVPLDKTRRTWGGFEYGVFWATGGFAIYNYTTGSAIISYGLNAKQALAVGIVSPLILAIMCVICGVSDMSFFLWSM